MGRLIRLTKEVLLHMRLSLGNEGRKFFREKVRKKFCLLGK